MLKNIIVFLVLLSSAGFAFADVSYSALLGLYHNASSDYKDNSINSAIKNYIDAIKLSAQYIEENPDNPKGYDITLNSYKKLGKIYTEQGDADNLINLYKECKEIPVKLYSLSNLKGKYNPYFEEYKTYFNDSHSYFTRLKAPVKYNYEALYFILKVDPHNQKTLNTLNEINKN